MQEEIRNNKKRKKKENKKYPYKKNRTKVSASIEKTKHL